MSSSKPESPKDSAGQERTATGKSSAKAGQDRLAAALRDNLKRRKAQARARQAPDRGRHEG